ncbi:MAG: hypothetical protein Q9163_003023 [Psora crenata]
MKHVKPQVSIQNVRLTTVLAQQPILSKHIAPAAIASSRIALQKRYVAFEPSQSPPQTTPAKPEDAYNILAKQRRNRPVSPHLSIYQAQITWYASGLNRITGSVLSGAFYLFGAAYLFSPLFGWHLESAHLAEMFGSLGPVTKGLIKFVVAMPFCFHGFNGVRHLLWDTGRLFGNITIARTGWVVVGLTVVGSGILAYM